MFGQQALSVAGLLVWNLLLDSLCVILTTGGTASNAYLRHTWTYWCIQHITGSTSMRYI